jgi:hypothetical protein
MNVYKRPMFLQGGGPPAPMAAAPMAAAPNAGAGAGIPPELQMALAGAEQEGAAIGQGIGGQLVGDMMQGLDGAEDYEQIINAIRGNELPLSARYDELGEIVGEEDASGTPESVLALTQPAIMMTEEGAMNSGIGELMQNLTGDVSMEGGMEGGVGSLMAAGQPAEPPMGPPPMGPGPDPTAPGPIPNGTPQGFAVGGAVNRFRGSPVVQNFQAGGLSSLADLYKVQPTSAYYQQNLGELRDIIDTDEQRNLAKSQILFDIARRGLAFAGGVNPETGQRMTGSPVSQFATAASGLPKTIGEQMSAVRAQEQKLKLAAYQGAQAKRAAAIERATATTTAAPGAHILKFNPKTGKMETIGKVPAKPLRALAASPHYTEFTADGKIYRTRTFDINKPNAETDAETALREKYPKLTFGSGTTYQVGTKQKPTKPLAVQEPYELTVINNDGKKVTTIVPGRVAEKGGSSIRKWVKANDNLKDDFGGAKGAANFLKSYTVDKLSTSEVGGKGTIGSLSWITAQSLDPVNMEVYRDPLTFLGAADTKEKVDDVRRIMDTLDQAAINNVVGTVDNSGHKTIKGLRGPMLQALRSRMAILKRGKYGDTPLSPVQERLLQLPPSVEAYINRLDSTIRARKDVDDTSKQLNEGRLGRVDPKTVDNYIRTPDFRLAFGGAPAAIKKGFRLLGKLAMQDWFTPSKTAASAMDTLYITTRKVVQTPLVGERSRDSVSQDFSSEFEALEAGTESPFTTEKDAEIHANNVISILKRALTDTIVVYKAAEQTGTPASDRLRLKAHARMLRLKGALANWDWVYASLANSAKGNTPSGVAEDYFKREE